MAHHSGAGRSQSSATIDGRGRDDLRLEAVLGAPSAAQARQRESQTARRTFGSSWRGTTARRGNVALLDVGVAGVAFEYGFEACRRRPVAARPAERPLPIECRHERQHAAARASLAAPP